MKIVTITLMRKGSKRFPGKIFENYKGKPLYMHTVEKALQLGYPYYLFHDCGPKLDLPEQVPGVFEVRERSEYFAGDTHRTCEEILKSGIDADAYIFLQVTSPRRSLTDMKKWISEFKKSMRAQAGVAVHIMPDGFYYSNQGKQVNFNQESRTDNGCVKKKVWKETGAFYIFKKDMLKEKHILDTNNKIFFFDKFNIDVDRKEDLE